MSNKEERGKFKKYFVEREKGKLVDRGNEEDEAVDTAVKRFKALLENKERLEEEITKWKASMQSDDDTPAPAAKKKAAPKRKAASTDEVKEKKKKVRMAPDDIPLPESRAPFTCTMHFDKNGRPFWYNPKTNDSSWTIPPHEYKAINGHSLKELGFAISARGTKVSKKGTRKGALHGYHVFVKKFDPPALNGVETKGVQRILLAAAAWKILTDAEKAEWKAKSVIMNKEINDKKALEDAESDDAEPEPVAKKTPAAASKKARKEAEKKVEVKADPAEFDW